MAKKKKHKLTPAQQQKRAERLSNLGLALKTLINNDACIKTSREWGGFKGHGVPIIVGILSILLALIPSFVTRINVNAGEAFLGSTSYSYNVGLAEFVNVMESNSAHIKIENGTIKKEGNTDLVFNYTEKTSVTKWYHETSNRLGEPVTVFEAFINDVEGLDDYTFFTRLAAEVTMTPDGIYRDQQCGWNYIGFGKETIGFAAYKSNGTLVTSFRGRYDKLEGVDLIHDTMPAAGVEGYDKLNAITNNWKGIINRAYETIKIEQTMQYVGILAGVYAGLLVLFGFLIWVMTRGKNNPMRVFTIWQTQRMSYWASFAPAVLSIIAGFLLAQSSLGMFAFIFLFGMRIMWMSMKALRPVQ